MSVTSHFDKLLERIVETDRRTARRTGEHIDRMSVGLQRLKEDVPQAAVPAPIPGGTVELFMKSSISELKDLARRFKVPRYTVCCKHIKGRGKEFTNQRLMVYAELLVQHGVPALTYENLLNFYLSAVGMPSKSLPNS
tara:strand:- start:61 stop:474 length:414 start_codon:yes stop_codon:yes gene_type:complete